MIIHSVLPNVIERKPSTYKSTTRAQKLLFCDISSTFLIILANIQKVAQWIVIYEQLFFKKTIMEMIVEMDETWRLISQPSLSTHF